ncbi:MAG: hypothetical protein WDN27_02905 [Candidatus Saccharibacteria bacterium]
MDFVAKTSVGSAGVNLNGSTAANNGTAVSLITTGSTITLAAGNNDVHGSVAISGISVSNVTQNSAVVHWTTSVPATSSVAYGSSIAYGFNAGSPGLATTHAVQLQTVFAGATIVHFSPSSIDAAGNSGIAADQTFKTSGYTVGVTVLSSGSRIVRGARVSVDGQTAITDSSGNAIVADVAPGVQKLKVNGGRTQFVAVQAVTGTAATQVQKFTVTAQSSPLVWYIVGGTVLLIVLVTGIVRYKRRAIIKAKAEQAGKEQKLEEALEHTEAKRKKPAKR